MKLRSFLAALMPARVWRSRVGWTVGGTLICLPLAPVPLHAAWDSTKPAAGTALASAEVRNNFIALQRTLGYTNLLADPTYLMWPNEVVNTDSANTDQIAHWTLSGAGATMRRTGTGLADTNRKVGQFAVKMTSGGGAPSFLSQNILSTTTYDDFMDGQLIYCGEWVRATVASTARIEIDDGAGSTISSYHTGGSSWEWLTVSRTISASATQLVFKHRLVAAQAAHYSGATCWVGEVGPAWYVPAPIRVRDERILWISGAVTTGTTKEGVRFVDRPRLVTHVQLRAETAPTGQALIVDVESGLTGATTSMFSTRPQIAAGANQGGAAPDGTYSARTLREQYGATLAGYWRVDVDQVGSGAAGSDLNVWLRTLEYERPLEAFIASVTASEVGR